MNNQTRISRDELHERTIAELRAAWQSSLAMLPSEAADWPAGAAYVRESDAESLEGSQPVVQLEAILKDALSRRIRIDWSHVYFEQISGTELDPRVQFRRVIAEAEAGAIRTVFAHTSSRLFRNQGDAIAVTERLRVIGVAVHWVGRPDFDPRSPTAWMSDNSSYAFDEMLSRNIGYQVGTNLEKLSAAGRPLGHLPESYEVADRGPTLRGKLGRPVRYRRVYPLARIVREGGKRYIAGASFRTLAEWSLMTELRGRTPTKGHVMDAGWWRSTLLNPKHAGLQMASVYSGFKPGKGSPKRLRRNSDSPLVPCMLPRIFTRDEFEQIVATAKGRTFYHPPSAHFHRTAISGLAVDVRCGHKLQVWARKQGGRMRMWCNRSAQRGGCTETSFFADDIELDMRQLLASIDVSDPALLAAIEQELAALDADAEAPPPPAREIIELRRAIASLGSKEHERLRHELERDLFEREQKAPPDTSSARRLRLSIDQLRQWPEIVARADDLELNEVLRAALLRIWIQPTERLPKGKAAQPGLRAANIVAIEPREPILGVALAAALRKNAVPVAEEAFAQWLGTDGPRFATQPKPWALSMAKGYPVNKLDMARPARLELTTFRSAT